MAGFNMRVRHEGDEEFGEYVYIELGNKHGYAILYHLFMAMFIGWPAEWAKRWVNKHEKWLDTEYNIHVFQKRVDDFDE